MIFIKLYACEGICGIISIIREQPVHAYLGMAQVLLLIIYIDHALFNHAYPRKDTRVTNLMALLVWTFHFMNI